MSMAADMHLPITCGSTSERAPIGDSALRAPHATRTQATTGLALESAGSDLGSARGGFPPAAKRQS